MIKTKRFYLLYLLLFITWGCTNENSLPEPSTPDYLIDSQLQGNETVESVKAGLAPLEGSSLLTAFIQSGFEKVRIEYRTKDPRGNSVTASGALLVPTDFSGDMTLLSYQHGTIFNEREAPSYFDDNTEVGLAGILASTGVIVAMPDYLGYGSSSNLDHPYEHRKSAASVTVDMLFAVKEYLSLNNIATNGKLILGGYSQGGYSTLSALQLLEESYSDEFTIYSALCGAGAYDKTATFIDFATNGSSGDINNNRSYLWVLLTYIDIYELPEPLSYYFREPYVDLIDAEGHLSEIPQSIDKVMTDRFREDLLSGNNPAFVAALKDNDLIDWTPRSKVLLLHGDADNYVPILNSRNALRQMQLNGATNVSLQEIKGGTHASSIQDFFLLAFQEVLNSK